MDLNDPSLFTPTITPDNNPFEFVEDSAVHDKPGATTVMSGYEVGNQNNMWRFSIHFNAAVYSVVLLNFQASSQLMRGAI